MIPPDVRGYPLGLGGTAPQLGEVVDVEGCEGKGRMAPWPPALTTYDRCDLELETNAELADALLAALEVAGELRGLPEVARCMLATKPPGFLELNMLFIFIGIFFRGEWGSGADTAPRNQREGWPRPSRRGCAAAGRPEID
jgi:hypothetical protein